MESGTSTFLGMDIKGKRLNGQARRLTYPSLQVPQQNLHRSCRNAAKLRATVFKRVSYSKCL